MKELISQSKIYIKEYQNYVNIVTDEKKEVEQVINALQEEVAKILDDINE